jgi:tRNA(Ile)-lysidine synthase
MPPPRGLVQRLDQELHREACLPRGKRLLVAVSGGADSVALLRLLCEISQSKYWQWELVVGHVDHGMRGAASAGDARFVEKLAREMKLPVIVRRLRLGKNASEDDMRRARFKAFAAMIKAKSCACVVMAHHADDQAETVLMRALRGCGLWGLSAMAPISDIEGMSDFASMTICRPLLGLRRANLRGYLKSIGQPWRDDASNALPRYTRNRLREELMPVIERLYPGGVDALCRLADVAREAQYFISKQAVELLAASDINKKSAGMIAPHEKLRTQESALLSELLRLNVHLLGGSQEIADFERIRAGVHLIWGVAGGKQIELGRGITLRIEKGLVKIMREPATKKGPRGRIR